ncbi:unnamed protein product [Calypogeia fissa]
MHASGIAATIQPLALRPTASHAATEQGGAFSSSSSAGAQTGRTHAPLGWISPRPSALCVGHRACCRHLRAQRILLLPRDTPSSEEASVR